MWSEQKWRPNTWQQGRQKVLKLKKLSVRKSATQDTVDLLTHISSFFFFFEKFTCLSATYYFLFSFFVVTKTTYMFFQVFKNWENVKWRAVLLQIHSVWPFKLTGEIPSRCFHTLFTCLLHLEKPLLTLALTYQQCWITEVVAFNLWPLLFVTQIT